MFGGMKFRELIREARIKMKLPVGQLAEEVGISRQYLGDLEDGTRKPSEGTALALAHELKLEPAVVLASAGIVSAPARIWLNERPDVIELIEQLARSDADKVFVKRLLKKVAP